MAFSFGNVWTPTSAAPSFAPTMPSFGSSATTPSMGTSSFASSFAAPMAAPPPSVIISGNMLYSQLPSEMKQAIDRLHETMTRHRKTMVQLQSMGPELLQPLPSSSSTKPGTTPLQEQLHQTQSQYQRLAQDWQKLQTAVAAQQSASQEALTQATLYAAWPVEGLAARQGVRLSRRGVTPEDGTASPQQQLLDEARTKAVARVDSIHRMPSPYYWDQLHALEQRALDLMKELQKAQQQPLRRLVSTEDITHELEEQDLVLQRVTAHVQHLREQMQRLRVQYRLYEKGVNVLDQHAIQEQERQRHLQEQVVMQYVQATQSTSTSTSTNIGSVAPTTTTPFGATTPASAPFGTAGSTTFGAAPTAFGAAPAPNLFGAAPATAFGATPAPTAFGATPAPTTAFGSTTPAPAPFGSTTPAPATFGSATPAPAFGSATPAPVFGSTTPAPVTTPAFGAATPAFGATSSSTANKKNRGGSRGLGRVRR